MACTGTSLLTLFSCFCLVLVSLFAFIAVDLGSLASLLDYATSHQDLLDSAR